MDLQKKEYSRRAREIRRQFKKCRIDGLIVMGLENVRYLTGFSGHDSWALVLPRNIILITDSRYTEQSIGECVNCRIVERKGGLAKEIQKIVSKLKGIEALGVEDSCSVSLLKGIRKALSSKVKPVSRVVETVRMVKTDDEVKLIRKAARIAFDAMDQTLKQLKVGMTERQLAALYEYKLSDYGAKIGFETIACFGPNGSRNHHQPGSRKLKKTDTILLDFGANYAGYTSDATRCFAVGKVTPFFRKVYETVARSQQNAIAMIKAGVKGCAVDEAARAIIAETDLPVFGHGTGHGLGLEVHEAPGLSGVDKKTVLKAGHVVTVEPGIYLSGKLGVRLEDDVLVTKDGAKILSRDKRFDIKPDMIPLLKV
ncbi:MAG: M24 family metallopeptidase [Planctomycetota bacterium]|jgi:Xaa-Pro aminopeptidase